MWKKILQPLFEADKLVKGYERKQHQKRLCCITIIAAIGLVVMSILNALEHSWPMMYSTLGAVVVLSICLLTAWKKKRVEVLENVFLVLFMILFPVYIIRGANGGFAILWLTIIPIVFMLMIDLKKGFFFSAYMVLFISVLFYSPFHRVLQYNYGTEMRLRFPVMLLICFLISFYAAQITIRAKSHMYQALTAAEQANRAKTTFLNNMSHDIRTPMNAIIGFTALCEKSIDDPEKLSDYLNKIATSSNHLLSLINDILDMSRIESGKVRVEEHEVYLPDVLHDLRTIIQSDVMNKNLELLIDTLDVKDENVFCDKLRLNQILLNLMSNAIKYTNPGGTISLRVEQKPCRKEGYAEFVFRVRDTGIGMSKEFLKVVFQPFERMQTATVSGIQGTGLGMSITKNLVEMMGGTIEAASEEGKGSEFTVTLQFRKSKNEVVYEKIPELQGVRVLVADDDSDTCFSVSRMLTEMGLRPDWTTSGKEAVVRARYAIEEKDEYGAYVIDWLMPDMNGIETIRRIRRFIGAGKPIIVLTAYDWEAIEEEAREAGVTSFCAKPLFMSELREALTTTRKKKAKEEKDRIRFDFSGKKVLLVEDNDLNLEIATEILKEVGLTVDTANDGDIAVEKMKDAKEGQYDLILMDVQMPRLDGYTATREIRTLPNPFAANIPIIAMTANAFEEDKRKSFEAGMNGHLSKPIEIPKLMKVLESILKEGK